jgi:hypothetical protein
MTGNCYRISNTDTLEKVLGSRRYTLKDVVNTMSGLKGTE